MSKIVLNENDLNKIIKESIDKIINEAIENGGLDETLNEDAMQWLKNKGKQIKTGFNTATRKGNVSLANRLKTGYQNYKTQGKLNDLVDLRNMLQQGVQSGKITPDMTVGQLIGLGKGNGTKKGQRGSLTNVINANKGAIVKRGGEYNEEE